MPVSEIPLKGAHNVENVLAAVVCGAAGGGFGGDDSGCGARSSRRWSIGWSLCGV